MSRRPGLIPSAITLTFLAALWGCGFKPLLATQDNGASPANELGSVRVASIEGRTGQVLRNDLITVLTPRGEPDRPKYTLVITVQEPQTNLAFQRDNSISFVSAAVNARWSLLNNNGTIVFSGASSSSSRYVISNSPYATTTSADNTRDLNAQGIAEDIRDKLAQYFLTSPPIAQKSHD